jgi:hypothetical protein
MADDRIVRRLLRSSGAASIIFLAACGSSDDSVGSAADSGADVTSGMDSGNNPAIDSGIDATSGRDSGSDATAPNNDAGSDASVPIDGASPLDATPDVETDATTDAEMDAATDAEIDAATDAATDAAIDAGIDSGPMCAPATTFALSKLAFGDGVNGQWKGYGFNIDGLVSTATSTDVCQPNSGGSAAAAYPDGNNGIDNSFGKNLLPIILGLDPNLPTDTNTALLNGVFSTLLEMNCLPPTGDAPSFLTKLFVATALGSTPKWDGTDVWPVAPELLSNPADPDSSTITFAMSSVTGTTFDSGKNQTVVLWIPMNVNGRTNVLKLKLYAAEVTMNLSADRKSATGGMIGGVLNTEELVTQVNAVGYTLGLCGNSLLTNLLTQVRQASDIMSDGTQDPTKTCDGISIGLGFEMKQAQRGDIGPASPTQMTCP